MTRKEAVSKIIEDSVAYLYNYLSDSEFKMHAITYDWTERDKAYVTAIIYGIERYLKDCAGLMQVYLETGKYKLDDERILLLLESRASLGERILHKIVDTMCLEFVFFLGNWLNDEFIMDDIIGTYELCAFEKKHEGECLKLEED